jgi:hypothetical protein
MKKLQENGFPSSWILGYERLALNCQRVISKNTAHSHETSSTLQPLTPARSKFWQSVLEISAERAGLFVGARTNDT